MCPVGSSSISTVGGGSLSSGSLSEEKQASDLLSQLPECVLEIEDGKTLLCRPMKADDYPSVRNMMPQVSRCHTVLPPETISKFLSYATFFPYVVCYKDEIIGYAEIHRLPHFGRGYDGRLEKVLITEAFRGQKVAQRFCSFLCNLAKEVLDCGRVDLTVEKPAAKAVYTNLGFSKVETEVWRRIF